MENTTPLDQQVTSRVLAKRDLPDAGGILAMGIIAIPFCLGLIGLILSIVVLTKSKTALNLYHSDPDAYTETSLSRVKSGRICAIVSLSLFGAGTLIILAVMAGN